MADLKHRTIATNGIQLHVVEAGLSSGEPVVLCHGFPELWYSWRHQIPALADAGYHVIAPDQRGYGESDKPVHVDDYGIGQLTGDLLGLLDEFGHDEAVFVGHDWGALITWGMARLHPARVRAMCAMSVPLFSPELAPVEHFTKSAGEGFYVVQFQQPGAEAGMAADPRATFRAILGTPPAEASTAGKTLPAEAQAPPPVAQLPAWLTEDDIDYFASAFEKGGFFGPVSYYRNLDANWLATKDIPYEVMSMPILFMTGSEDWVHTSPWGGVAGTKLTGIEAMRELLPDFRGTVLIEGAGHWNQQEKAAATTAALLEFLAGATSTPTGAQATERR
jgi:pimeloyl-ACP methyl ester carboxylesterase